VNNPQAISYNVRETGRPENLHQLAGILGFVANINQVSPVEDQAINKLDPKNL
jgi:hypothetical protein